MVIGARMEGGPQVLSAGVRRTIQSIKEIVGNHSDSDIYVALKETNMDPNETAQKLLNQDPFHEVKRKRDRRKENAVYKSFVAPEPRKNTDPARVPDPRKNTDPARVPDPWKNTDPARVPDPRKNTELARAPEPRKNIEPARAPEPRKNTEPERVPESRKYTELARFPVKNSSYPDRNVRRVVYGRNNASGASREFRVVRDNRVNQNASADTKPAQSSISSSEVVITTGSMKSNSKEIAGHQEPPVGQHSSRALSIPADSQSRQTRVNTPGGHDRKEINGEKLPPIPSATSRVQTKANGPQQYSTTSSSNSVVGVYSSNSDPVHVPSLHSRPAANVGAIRREVGVVGPRRQPSEKPSQPSGNSAKPSQSSENSVKPSSSQSTPLPNAQSGRDGQPRESARSFNTVSKNDQSNQNMAPESAVPNLPPSKSFSSNQYGGRHHQPMGHQKAPQPNKEWKPKSIAKPSATGPGVIGNPAKTVSPPADNPDDLKKEAAQVQDSMSRMKITENQNVIIASHIRVSETDRCRLTFGSLGTELDASTNSVCTTAEGAEPLSNDPSGSVSVSVPESSGDEPAGSKQLEMIDDSDPSSGPDSPASVAASDHQLTERESSRLQNLDNYADVGLVQENSPSYTPESLQQQDTPELASFSGYDPQMGYDISYFRPIVDEAVRGQPGLPSSQEVLNTHTTNAIPSSTIAMVQQQQQQQQQQLAQMYPHLHVSHFANLMPYRQFLSPVYVPPMPVPGYSNSAPYPHPSNNNSYVLMPGNSSHLTASGVKYGIQQFKPMPNGNQTGFGNFSSPAGYAINTPGGVASGPGHDETSRLKYKDNLYVPNPQAETSEIWMNPRDLSGLQSASYYNIPGQTPHPAYMASHSGHHPSFTTPQSSHMQFPGMYHHPSQQPGGISGPHHMGPAIGGNVGVGVAAPGPGAQVGPYQQPQLGQHLNWTGNF